MVLSRLARRSGICVYSLVVLSVFWQCAFVFAAAPSAPAVPSDPAASPVCAVESQVSEQANPTGAVHLLKKVQNMLSNEAARLQILGRALSKPEIQRLDTLYLSIGKLKELIPKLEKTTLKVEEPPVDPSTKPSPAHTSPDVKNAQKRTR